MVFMNEWEIDEARERFSRDPVLGPAAKFLAEFRDEVNSHSDGWPYWSPPVKSAAKLIALLNGHLRAGLGAYPVLPRPTVADVRRALTPIKAFMTRRGFAAGMKMPEA